MPERTSPSNSFPSWEWLARVFVVASVLLPGCTCNRQPKIPVKPLPNLDSSDWVLTDSAAKDFADPPPETEAEFEVVEQGLQVTTYERSDAVHVVFRQELVDDFEITARIVRPSVEELRAAGLAQPSPFPGLIGFRGPSGANSFRTQLKRDQETQQVFDVVLRASSQWLSFTVNGQKSSNMLRRRVAPGHFFIEVPKNNRAYIASLEVREGLEPDPALVAAAERAAKQPPMGMDMSMAPPGMFGPIPPMFGPSFSGFSPATTSGGEPPGPSRLESLLSKKGWSVPSLGSPNLDTAIAQDLRLEANENGLTVAKTSTSGAFWLVNKIERAGDFTATYRVSIPSMGELASIAGPTTLLAVGVYASENGQRGVIAQAPPPSPTGSRVFDVTVLRKAGRVTLDVAGTPLGGSVRTDSGCWLDFICAVAFASRFKTFASLRLEPKVQ